MAAAGVVAGVDDAGEDDDAEEAGDALDALPPDVDVTGVVCEAVLPDDADDVTGFDVLDAAGDVDVTTVVVSGVEAVDAAVDELVDEPVVPDALRLFDGPDATVASDATVVLAVPLRVAPAFEVDCDPPPPPHAASSTLIDATSGARRGEDSEDKEAKERETFAVKLAMSINSIRITKWACCYVESTKQAHRTRRSRAADLVTDLPRTSGEAKWKR